MRGAVFTGDRIVELRDFPDPQPTERDVVVEIKASGICGSDLRGYRTGPDQPGIIAGHEPAGVIAAVGSGVADHEASVGQRVMVHHYSGCGVCRHCCAGWSQMCEHGARVFGFSADGGHADLLRIPVASVIPLPDAVSFEIGAAISCGTGTAFNAIRRVGARGDETLLISGLGPVGASATQFAASMGIRVIAVDPVGHRRDAAMRLGAAHTIDPADGDPVEIVEELTGGTGADRAIDCTPSEDARRIGARCLRPWGTLCLVGVGGRLVLDMNTDVIRKQLTVVGSWTFSKNGQRDCADFIASRNIDVAQLFTDRWSLDDVGAAYEHFDRQGGGKAVIVP